MGEKAYDRFIPNQVLCTIFMLGGVIRGTSGDLGQRHRIVVGLVQLSGALASGEISAAGKCCWTSTINVKFDRSNAA